MAFVPAYREGGGPIEARTFYIPTATVIEKGEIVQLTPGTGIAVLTEGTDFDDPALGVAAEVHAANSGYSILVYCDPDIVYKVVPKTLSTVDSGDATSWIDAEYTAADDIFNGGKIVIVGTNSVSGFSVGDVLDITDFANTGGDFTVTGAGGTIAAGITGYIYPGSLAVGSFAFDLNSDGTNINMKTAGGQSLIIVRTEWDGQKKETTVFCKLRLHQFGNHVVAL